jgi:hypothetical protein
MRWPVGVDEDAATPGPPRGEAEAREKGAEMMSTVRRLAGLRGRVALVLALGATVGVVAPAAAAAAAAPPNDDRDAATALGALPQSVTGTTAGSTVEGNEPASNCAGTAGSVWYALPVGAVAPPRIGIKLAANGNLDAVVDVYARQRSQLVPVSCRATDRAGRAAVAFSPQAGTTYLIRVSRLADSSDGTFALDVLPLPGPARPPGAALTARGVQGTLDGTLNPTVAYSMTLTAGTIYKVNLVKRAEGCMSLGIFAPGTTSFSISPVAGLSCAGYRLFTPRVSGLFSFLITAADGNPGTQPYGLHVLPATAQETAPGILLANNSRFTGYLRGWAATDVRLFRFDVTDRSDLTLFLQAASNAPFDLKLIDDRGHYLQCDCGSTGEETIRRQVSPGRYFVVVQAEGFAGGPFTLYRQSRLITHVKVTADGRGFEQVAPGAAVRLAATVTPAVDGPVTMEVDSFDPVEGWLYDRTYHLTAIGGVAAISFVPPHVGRWRAAVSYDGTRTASPATSGTAQALVAGPLQQ